MRTWSALLMASLLAGQETKPVRRPSTEPAVPHLHMRMPLQTPQDLMHAMVAQYLAQRSQPGATVEVIGYDDETALKLLSLKVAERVRLEFHATDTLAHRELYAFMHQDPSHPSPVLFVPRLAGGTPPSADAKWLK